jgi:hypothetical protein
VTGVRPLLYGTAVRDLSERGGSALDAWCFPSVRTLRYARSPAGFVGDKPYIADLVSRCGSMLKLVELMPYNGDIDELAECREPARAATSIRNNGLSLLARRPGLRALHYSEELHQLAMERIVASDD